MAVSLIAQIHKQLGQHLPLATFFQAATIEQMAEILRQQITFPEWSPLIEIQPFGSQPPLFCVPGAGGNVIYFYDLACCLGVDQPFYGLQVHTLNKELERITQVKDIAAYYIEAIRTVQPQGPYRIGGHSFGGLIAFEMALQFQAQGEKVVLLALLDSTPTTQLKFEEDDPAIIAGLFQEYHSLSLESLEQISPDDQLLYAIEQLRQANVIPPDFGLTQAHSLLQIYKTNIQVGQSYVPQHYPGRVTLFQATERYGKYSEDITLGWGALAAEGVDIHKVPGNHYTMMHKPNVQVLAEQLKHCLQQVYANS